MTMQEAIVVTGGSSGIGRAVVERILERGGRVVAVARDAERLAAVFGDRPDVVRVAADLTTDEGFDRLTGALEGCPVKGFVHAAGFDAAAPLGFLAPGTFERLMAIHAGFPIRFLGWLGKKGHFAPGCSCVLISSLAAHEGAKGHVAYAAAKGAVEGLLKPAAAELAAKGIRLNVVVPGVVETEMSRGWLSKLTDEQRQALAADYPLGLGRPEDVASTICHLLSEETRWITGSRIVLDGGRSLT